MLPSHDSVERYYRSLFVMECDVEVKSVGSVVRDVKSMGSGVKETNKEDVKSRN
jgi:hypothetical protein